MVIAAPIGPTVSITVIQSHDFDDPQTIAGVLRGLLPVRTADALPDWMIVSASATAARCPR
jgi:hypothetical protein